MDTINVQNLNCREINQLLRTAPSGASLRLTGCLGQRFLAAGMTARHVEIDGIPGNALGAYLNGGSLTVHGNAQDAVGDTMNAGDIIVHGNIGDAAGYAMRGGRIFVKGNAGYRAGIQMKAYEDKVPVMIIGGRAGSFLGEYQAGGLIIVLGIGAGQDSPVGNFPCTGMHGGKLFLRGYWDAGAFPGQVTVSPAGPQDLDEIRDHVRDFAEFFGQDFRQLMNHPFTLVRPDSRNPYKQMYVQN